MQITAALVKQLRERTGAGMMDCKKALQAAAGDIETAIQEMRKSGAARAAAKAGRIAAEGIIRIRRDGNAIILLEINCETDFVARDENFLAFAGQVLEVIAAESPADIEALLGLSLGAQTVAEARQELVARIGEKVTVRRFQKMALSGNAGTYLHGSRIGAVVELEGGDEALARDIAMHIAASRPVCVSQEQVPQALLDREREIISAQAAESGKPPAIVERIVAGRISKFLKDITLLGQPFVKDTDQTVAGLLKAAGAKVTSFLRYEVGEGIEKKADNFAEEVLAQARETSRQPAAETDRKADAKKNNAKEEDNE